MRIHSPSESKFFNINLDFILNHILICVGNLYDPKLLSATGCDTRLVVQIFNDHTADTCKFSI